MSASRPLVWTPELVARFWDFESGRQGHYFAEQYGAAIVRAFADLIPVDATLLDYGCGAGGLIPHLLERSAQVFGLDHSPASRAAVADRFRAHARFAGVLAPDEAARLTGGMDAVFCVEVVEHLSDPVLDELVAAIRRLLRPTGVAIFTTPNDEDLAKSEILCPNCEQHFHRWQHVRSWEAATLRQALERRGFTVVRTVETDFRADRAVSRRRWLRRWLRRVRRRKVRSPHLAIAVRPSGAAGGPG